MSNVSDGQKKAIKRYRNKNREKVYKQSLYRAAEKFLTEMVNDLDDVRMYQEAITERRRELNDK